MASLQGLNWGWVPAETSVYALPTVVVTPVITVHMLTITIVIIGLVFVNKTGSYIVNTIVTILLMPVLHHLFYPNYTLGVAVIGGSRSASSLRIATLGFRV